MPTDTARVELSGLNARDALVVEGILSHESGESGVKIEHRDVEAGIDPTGVSVILGVVYLGVGLAAYVARVVFSIRRQISAFSVVDLRDGQVKIIVDANNKAMAGKTLVVADLDDKVTIEQDKGLAEIVSALQKLGIEK